MNKEGLVSRSSKMSSSSVIPTHEPKESSKKMDSWLRYGTLIILVLQTASTVLLLRYSRTRPGRTYLASTAVMLNECCKFTVCVFSLYTQRGFSIRRSWRAFRDEILGRPRETIKLIVPSGLYCLQNNLLFIALTNLDAATYQVIVMFSTRIQNHSNHRIIFSCFRWRISLRFWPPPYSLYCCSRSTSCLYSG